MLYNYGFDAGAVLVGSGLAVTIMGALNYFAVSSVTIAIFPLGLLILMALYFLIQRYKKIHRLGRKIGSLYL